MGKTEALTQLSRSRLRSARSIDVSCASVEFRLAALCCRYPWTEQDSDELRELLAKVEEAKLLDLVIRRHRIGPMALAALTRLSPTDVPEALVRTLAAETRANVLRALRSQRAHVLLSRKLAALGIDWLAFKGITLEQRYYKDTGVRHANDIDIWVPIEKRAKAREALRELGFQSADPIPHRDLAARGSRHAEFLDAYFIEEVYSSSEFCPLELHWQLAINPGVFRLEPQTIHERGEVTLVGGEPVRVMNDVDLLLYLCEHGSRHGWARLKWLADLPRVLTSVDWNWTEVFDRASNAGCAKSLALGLVLSRDLMGWPMPSEAAALADRWVAVRWAARLVRSFQDAPAIVPMASLRQWVPHRARELMLTCLLVPNFRALSGQTWRLLISPHDLGVVRLPDRWFCAYFVMRLPLLVFRRARGWLAALGWVQSGHRD